MMKKTHAEAFAWDKGTPRIVGVVCDEAEWGRLRKGACDLVELRLDALEKQQRDLPSRVPSPVPLLLTFRHLSEGGYDRVVSETDRVQQVLSLLPFAAAFDWEIAQADAARELIRAAHQMGVLWFASAHFWDGTPKTELLRTLEDRAVEAGADVLKVAFSPQNDADVQAGLAWLTEPTHKLPIALMGMGSLAGESRVLYARHGSCLVYAHLGAQATAPGQWSVDECRRILMTSQGR